MREELKTSLQCPPPSNRRLASAGRPATFVSGRRGTGLILFVIALFLVIATPICIARHVQASQSRNAVQWAAFGGIALDLGRSALTEALSELTRCANDRTDPLFSALRSKKEQIQTIQIPPRQIMKMVAGDPSLAGFEVAGGLVDAVVVSREPLSRLSYEARVVWSLAVKIVHRATGLVRTVVEERPMRIALLSVPRPYDQFTVLVLKAGNLVGSDLNTWLSGSAAALDTLSQKDKPETVKRLSEVVSFVNERIEAANDERSAGESKISAFNPVDYVSMIQETQIPDAPKIGNLVTDPLHKIPSSYSVATTVDRVDDLSQLYLLPRLKSSRESLALAESEYQREKGRFDDLARRIGGLAGRTAQSNGEKDALRTNAKAMQSELKALLPRLRSKMETLAKSHSGLLQQVRSYEDSWIETGGEASDWLVGFQYKLDPQEWAKRSFMRFEGQGATSRFLAFLDRYQKESPSRPVNGVVFVDNPGEPLRIEGRTIHGKLTVIATGAVDLRDVRLADRSNDLMVVQCEDTLKVGGRVESALIPRGAFLPESGVELMGPLVLVEVKEPDRLSGSVSSDQGRYYTGVAGAEKPEYLYAAFSPWALTTNVSCD